MTAKSFKYHNIFENETVTVTVHTYLLLFSYEFVGALLF